MSEQSTSSYVANSQGTFWCSKQENYSPAGTLQIHGWTEWLNKIKQATTISDILPIISLTYLYISSVCHSLARWHLIPPSLHVSPSQGLLFKSHSWLSYVFLAVFSYTSLPPLFLNPPSLLYSSPPPLPLSYILWTLVSQHLQGQGWRCPHYWQ